MFGVGAQAGGDHRQAERVQHLGEGGVHEAAFDGAVADAGGAHVEHRAGGAADQPRPGLRICMAETAPSSSATPCTTTPASVTGAVAPEIGTVKISIGVP